eukprot:768012-Hanusia_phi.AAC.8
MKIADLHLFWTSLPIPSCAFLPPWADALALVHVPFHRQEFRQLTAWAARPRIWRDMEVSRRI